MKVRCPTCAGSTRKGLLWLGGNDWLECPDCIEGQTEVIATPFTPRERIVSMVGVGSHVERQFHPSVAHLQDAICRSTA